MMSKYRRPQARILAARLNEPRRFIIAVTGPRQVGKTTLVNDVAGESGIPGHFASGDQPLAKGPAWIDQQWETARLHSRNNPATGAILVLDEIQKIPDWSEAIKRLWDEDTRTGQNLRVIVLGSAPWLIQSGLTESLAGRFETLHLPHWTFAEMRDAFGFSVDDYLLFGGYPGAAPLIDQPTRWRNYVNDSLIETTISRDVLMLTRVDKPALLRALFQLGCSYSGQIFSYTKMLGQLHDAGNTTTLAHYLDLLEKAGMLMGLQKYSGRVVRARASSPKLQVLNTALMTAQSEFHPEAARHNPEFLGRLTESAVGACLVNAAAEKKCEVYYWREGNLEVDFVVRVERTLFAIEVKTGRARDTRTGSSAFKAAHREARTLLVGGDGIPVETFLLTPIKDIVS